MEAAIRQSQHEEGKLGEAVLNICNKVDTNNNNIDNVIKETPTKLHVSVSAADADWKKIEEAFANHREWILTQNLKHFRQLVDERKKVQERYKEYDGYYLGHYIQ